MGGFGAVRDLEGRPAQHPNQLVVDRLDHLLARGQALGELGTNQLCPQAGDDVPHDEQVDVGLQQRQPDFPQRLVDVFLVEPAAAS